MWNQKTTIKKHKYREEIGGFQRQGSGRGAKMGEGGQNYLIISSYKINKSWGCNTEHGDYKLIILYCMLESC